MDKQRIEPRPPTLAGALVALGMPPATAEDLSARARPASREAGDLIERRGDRAGAVWFLVQGVVSHQVRLADGRPAVVALYGPGTLFNQQQALFDGPNGVDTVAMTPVALLAFDVPLYRRLIEQEPAFLHAMLRLTVHRATRLAEALAAFKHGSPAFRVAFVLGHFAQAFDPVNGFSGTASRADAPAMTLPVSSAALASMANVSRSTLSEVINELAGAGFVGRGARGSLRIERRAAWLSLRRRLQAEATLPARAGCAELVSALSGP
jgi:CRP/FNR family transcriptional regulator, cyclic AMP receptor protein